MSQGGDFIGGAGCGLLKNYSTMARKCMNSWICSTNKPFTFVGTWNEDVNAFIVLGSQGVLFLTLPFVGVEQPPTQSQKSGMTDIYVKYGTYCKAFTTVMMQPSSVKVSMLQSKNPRIHHSIKWINTTPKIIDEKYKKKQ